MTPYYQQYTPDAYLSNYIKCFWVLEELHPFTGSDEYVTPDSYIELIFNLGDQCILDQKVMPRTFLVGLQEKPLLFRAYGLTRILAVRFYGWSAQLIFGGPIRGLVTLGDDWEILASDLVSALRFSGYSRAVKLLREAIVEHIPHSLMAGLSQVQSAGRLLYDSNGHLSIVELAHRCGLTPRQLQRQFNHQLGISPKTLARTIRFEQISHRLYADPTLRLLDLTYEYGYTDQAHFVRDFKSFALKTPSEFARLAYHRVQETY